MHVPRACGYLGPVGDAVRGNLVDDLVKDFLEQGVGKRPLLQSLEQRLLLHFLSFLHTCLMRLVLPIGPILLCI